MNFGRVVPRHGKGRDGKPRTGFVIDLGHRIQPRYLTSARGARFDSRETAEAIPAAIRVKIAKGVEPQAAVDEFAPTTGERSACSAWFERYVAHTSERCDAGDLSPTTLQELRRFVRSDFAFWEDR